LDYFTKISCDDASCFAGQKENQSSAAKPQLYNSLPPKIARVLNYFQAIVFIFTTKISTKIKFTKKK